VNEIIQFRSPGGEDGEETREDLWVKVREIPCDQSREIVKEGRRTRPER